MTQHEKLGKLLQRKRGVTSLEIIQLVGTVYQHKRLSDLKDMGWTILRQPIEGQEYGRYFGVPPKVEA